MEKKLGASDPCLERGQGEDKVKTTEVGQEVPGGHGASPSSRFSYRLADASPVSWLFL